MPTYSLALRNAKLEANTTAVGNAGRVRIFTGAKGDTTTLLGEFTFAAAFAPAVVNGVQSPNLPPNVNATGSGVAGWYRVVTTGGVQVMDGLVGTEMTLNTTNISAGVDLAITGWTITAGNA